MSEIKKREFQEAQKGDSLKKMIDRAVSQLTGQ
jgi:hypothetical protein